MATAAVGRLRRGARLSALRGPPAAAGSRSLRSAPSLAVYLSCRLGETAASPGAAADPVRQVRTPGPARVSGQVKGAGGLFNGRYESSLESSRATAAKIAGGKPDGVCSPCEETKTRLRSPPGLQWGRRQALQKSRPCLEGAPWLHPQCAGFQRKKVTHSVLGGFLAVVLCSE